MRQIACVGGETKGRYPRCTRIRTGICAVRISEIAKCKRDREKRDSVEQLKARKKAKQEENKKMMRNVVTAIAVAAVLGVAAPMSALADPHDHTGHFGGTGPDQWSSGWGGPAYSYGFDAGAAAAPYAYDDAYGYGGCYQMRSVWTPFGWRMERVDVCD
jgi:hypothetical protein